MTKAFLLGFIYAASGQAGYENPYYDTSVEWGDWHKGYWDAIEVHDRPLKELTIPGRGEE